MRKILRDATEIVGNSILLISSGFFLFTLTTVTLFGGVRYGEPDKLVAITETLLACFGFLFYIKMLLKICVAKIEVET